MGLFAILLILFVASTGVLQQRAELGPSSPPTEMPAELHVLNVYGVRPDATGDIETLRILVELASGSPPHDMERLLLRYAALDEAGHYEHANRSTANAFTTTWIRGEGARNVMVPGDLVEVSLDLMRPLPPRTGVSLVLIPEAGMAEPADFRTPATYGADTVVTLR